MWATKIPIQYLSSGRNRLIIHARWEHPQASSTGLCRKVKGKLCLPPLPKKSHRLLYFHPKVNLKWPSSLSLPSFSRASAHLSQFSLQPLDPRLVQPCVPFRKLASASPDVIWMAGIVSANKESRWSHTHEEGSKHKRGQRWREKQEVRKMSVLMRGGRSWKH